MRIILAFEFQEAFPLAPTLALIIEKLEHATKDMSEGQASVLLSSFLYGICQKQTYMCMVCRILCLASPVISFIYC